MQKPAIKASQAAHQLKSGGYGLGCGAHPGWFSGELLNRFTYDRREATVKVCGVAVAMPQGQELGASSVDRLSISLLPVDTSASYAPAPPTATGTHRNV